MGELRRLGVGIRLAEVEVIHCIVLYYSVLCLHYACRASAGACSVLLGFKIAKVGWNRLGLFTLG